MRLLFLAALAAIVAAVLVFGLRSAWSAADAYEARRLEELDQELSSSIREGTAELRRLVARSRDEGAEAMPFPMTVKAMEAPTGTALERAERLERVEGREEAAMQEYLRILLDTEDPDEEVAAMRGIARIQARRGAVVQARNVLREALDIDAASELERSLARHALGIYDATLPEAPTETPETVAHARVLAAADPDQLVRLGDDAVAWRVNALGSTRGLGIAHTRDVLNATVAGFRAGRWGLVPDGGRVLPAPYPRLQLQVGRAERQLVATEAAERRTWLAVPPLLTAFLLFVGGCVAGLALRRRAEFERRKHAFLCAVTHELKTPIANISLYAETLREHGQDDAARVPRFAEVILQESERLQQRVQEVLDVATGRQGLPARDGRFDCAAVVREVCDVGRARGGAIELAGAAEARHARGGAELFHRALEGVLENALKFAPDGIVAVSLEGENGRVVVRVEDEGPGIPARECERVFEPFVRLGDEMTGGVPGTGLGLTLVRQCVEECGGSVRIEPRDGGGTRVVLELEADG